MKAVKTGGEFGAPPPSSDGSPSQASRATSATGSPISSVVLHLFLEATTAHLGDGTRRPTAGSPWSSPRRAMSDRAKEALSRRAQGRRDASAHRGHRSEVVDETEGVRVRRRDEWVAAVPDADRARAHAVAERTGRVLVKQFRDRVAAWRKEAV